MSILVFDIETVPDVDTGKKLYQLADLPDAQVAQAMFTLKRAKSGHDFLPHYLHKIVAISLVLHHNNTFKVWSLGDEHTVEKELISRFFLGLDKYTPTLVSWNGTGFDLPVLHYRALLHHISAPLYWEVGNNQQSFRWNNYLNRYHYRHLDLMDILANYQTKAAAPLDDLACILGFPGKMGMHGSKVWEYYLDNNLTAIRNYCETDVLNTFCVYLRFELMRGSLTIDDYQKTLAELSDYLNQTNKPHLQQFSAYLSEPI